ncbi:MAG: glutamine amidotransferase [Nitriliruptorales bacterium]|nr:glutamine amidotransferase [Nitriliruptorales bacterium]
MKPFLLLATRAVDRAADSEYEAMLRFSGLDERHLRRVRLEQGPLGPVDLDDWSGVILGGGPFNASDRQKSDVQRRVEEEIGTLLDEIVPRDFPFLGACYGIGTLGLHEGAIVDRTYSEPVGPMTITLTDQGRDDQLLQGLPPTFEAFLGHKEAIRTLPPHAVNLASSPTCPVQAFRVGRNVYATQFHPELDVDGIQTRIDVYKHAGYFAPEEAETLKARARASTVVHPPAILRRFVELFADGGGDPGRSR